MKADERPPRPGDAPRTFAAWFSAMPRWKKGLLGAAALCAVAGGVLLLLDHGDAATPASAGGTGPAGGAGFVPSGTGTGGGSAPTVPGEEPAAKGVFRLGSSFLVGFCMGAFVRAAVKIASIAVGFFFVALFALERADFVVVDWSAIDQAWSGFWAAVGEEWGDFHRFVTGRLPAAGLASLGLWAGFKRH